MRRQGQFLAAGLAGAALVVGVVAAAGPFSPDPATRRVGSTTGPSAPALPVIVRECWVPADSGNISLSAEEAKQLTTLAATTTNPGRREGRVRAAVEGVLEVTPEQAAAVTASLLGDRPAHRLTCSHARLAVQPESMGRSGLTPRAQRLRAAWNRVFGPLVAGGFARGGVSSGHVDSSAHYEGRAVDVFFRPLGDAEQRHRGRVFSQWLVAHAQDYNILSVIFADQIWTSWAASAGWREYVHPSGDTDNPVLRHLDHVHVAVESGRPWRPR